MRILIAIVIIGLVVTTSHGRQHKAKGRKQHPTPAVPAYQVKVPNVAPTQYQPSHSYQSAEKPKQRENYGPDASNFQYQVPVYDPKTYGNAAINVNRFPGGATYNINENSQGSDVKVNVETSPSGRQVQKPIY